MRNANGYACISGPGSLYGLAPEMDTFRCNHCGNHTRIEANTRPEDSTKGSKCWQCDSLICARCAKSLMGSLRCAPFEKKLNKWEGRKEYDRVFAMNKSTF